MSFKDQWTKWAQGWISEQRLERSYKTLCKIKADIAWLNNIGRTKKINDPLVLLEAIDLALEFSKLWSEQKYISISAAYIFCDVISGYNVDVITIAKKVLS